MMALDNCFLFPFQPSLDIWDTQTFELSDHHEFIPLAMESPLSSEASTGYLQDAVADWSDRCKRRRTASDGLDGISTTKDLQDLLQGFWDSNCHVDPLDDLNYMFQDNSTVSEDPLNSFMPMKGPSTQEANALPHQQEPLPSLSFQEKPLSKDPSGNVTHESKDSKACHPSPTVTKSVSPKETESRHSTKKKKKKAVGVVYPFVVVKPGGLEGDVTLDDINARLLMRPARPVHHPVGEYACGPCISPDGPGLSGKAVVSLTRIRTQGRGTITIIRTRG